MPYRGHRLPGRDIDEIHDDVVGAIRKADWPSVMEHADSLFFETGVEDCQRFRAWAQSMADAGSGKAIDRFFTLLHHTWHSREIDDLAVYEAAMAASVEGLQEDSEPELACWASYESIGSAPDLAEVHAGYSSATVEDVKRAKDIDKRWQDAEPKAINRALDYYQTSARRTPAENAIGLARTHKMRLVEEFCEEEIAALQCAEAAVRAHPDVAWAHVVLADIQGDMLMGDGCERLAIKTLEKAAAKADDIIIDKALASFFCAGIHMGPEQDSRRAIAVLQHALAKNPLDRTVFQQLQLHLELESERDAHIATLEASLQAFGPESFRARELRTEIANLRVGKLSEELADEIEFERGSIRDLESRKEKSKGFLSRLFGRG